MLYSNPPTFIQSFVSNAVNTERDVSFAVLNSGAVSYIGQYLENPTGSMVFTVRAFIQPMCLFKYRKMLDDGLMEDMRQLGPW